jgi:glycine cleavage system H protein
MSDANEVKGDRKYTKEHEWAKQSGSEVLVGITAFAVDQLGDITLVNVDLKVGDTIQSRKAFGTIESVKTLSDLYAPVSGKIVRINGELEQKPELINDDCWEQGWMIAIEPSDWSADQANLLDPNAYATHVKESAH